MKRKQTNIYRFIDSNSNIERNLPIPEDNPMEPANNDQTRDNHGTIDAIPDIVIQEAKKTGQAMARMQATIDNMTKAINEYDVHIEAGTFPTSMTKMFANVYTGANQEQFRSEHIYSALESRKRALDTKRTTLQTSHDHMITDFLDKMEDLLANIFELTENHLWLLAREIEQIKNLTLLRFRLTEMQHAETKRKKAEKHAEVVRNREEAAVISVFEFEKLKKTIATLQTKPKTTQQRPKTTTTNAKVSKNAKGKPSTGRMTSQTKNANAEGKQRSNGRDGNKQGSAKARK